MTGWSSALTVETDPGAKREAAFGNRPGMGLLHKVPLACSGVYTIQKISGKYAPE